MSFEWSESVDEATWWVDRLDSRWDTVGGFVPEGFGAFARVEHSDGFEGSLGRAELAALAELLQRHTPAPSAIWAAVWDGFGQICNGSYLSWIDEKGDPRTENRPPVAPKFVRDGPRIDLPSRELVLLRGAIDDLDQLYDTLVQQSPTVWWPHDRSWIVATEIDFSWTYVGGNKETIQAVLADPRPKARRVNPADPPE